MKIVVLRETQEGEARVALMPEAVKKLIALGATVQVETRAGLNAARTDDEYREAGAEIVSDREALLAESDVLPVVNRLSANDFARLKKGAVVIGFLRPLDEPTALLPAVDRGITTFSVELIPRITRAQAMDALSSMATVAGYKAVLIGAAHIPRMFPFLMTAAGTVPPARVLVLGAGVAGLQAIATARRLGAVVEGYDVRAAAGEQVRSLGATFLEVDLGGIKTEDAGGYAVELSDEAMNRGRALIAEHAKSADVIITTAQVPGRRAPLLDHQRSGRRNEAWLDRHRPCGCDRRQLRAQPGRRNCRTRWCNDRRADKSCPQRCRSTPASSILATSRRSCRCSSKTVSYRST